MKLKDARKDLILFSQLKRAENSWDRLIGLLLHKSLPVDEAIWFTRCNAIHTFFMKFPIDCVFVDRKGQVRKVYHNIQPWRWAGPVWGATDAVEMAAGQAQAKNIQVGDVIECGP